MVSFTALENQVFDIQNESDFEAAALAVFHYQAIHNVVYKKYLNLLNIHPSDVNQTNKIPFLPIEFFKSFPVVTGHFTPEVVFTSSGTTSQNTSRHLVKSSAVYIRSFLNSFRHFYGSEQEYVIIALLPSYLDRKGSSLIYMTDYLIRSGSHHLSGFYSQINKHLLAVLKTLSTQSQKKVILLGVTFALLQLAEQYPLDLSSFIVMETGGMKGQAKEITRTELYQILQQKLNISHVHSEYGMTEMLSQAYSKNQGHFFTPSHLKIMIRDLNDPFTLLEAEKSGVINIIDLANVHSCAFIATQDAGKIHHDCSFEVLGRVDYSDIRGCNLLMV